MSDEFNSPAPHDRRNQDHGRLDSPSIHNQSQMSISHTTPIDIRSRAALGSQGHGRRIMSQNSNNQNSMQSPEASGMQIQTIHEMSSTEVNNTEVIWGTNINAREVEEKFISFLVNFQAGEAEGDDQNIYRKKLDDISKSQQPYLDIDADHIFQFDKHLYQQLITFPSDIILFFDRAATRQFKEEYPHINEIVSIHVRIHHLRKKSRMRDLNPADINHLVCITGIVIRCSEIQPEMKEAHFRCVVCGHIELVANEGGRIPEPQDCIKCRTKSSFEVMHNLCLFSDRQYIKLQETPEVVPDGETPQTVTLVVYEELVDSVKPGDRVEITGIFRAQPLRVTANQRTLRSVFNTYLDVISFDFTAKQRFLNAEESEEKEQYMTEEVREKIHELADRPDIYELLTESLAPSIWENDDVKKGILCQLFGGCKKEFSQAGRGRFRAEINVLLIGDPSTAKSQLLKYVHNIAPRGIYTSGKGSSAVGLTASISKDPETRELVLESGAMVLSDQGICCIDEFDKMDENTRVILHEAMEQQTISIAKAGIVCQLNTRTAVLASANPVESRYNPKRSVIENIKLPPSLLSRFDLIYLMLDKCNSNMDRKLAEHILSLYTKDYDMEVEDQRKARIDRELLAKYISYARKANPVITDECVDHLVNAYIDMRRIGTSRNIITATPRQLESLIRLSEALAKMRLADTVSVPDVEEAIRLIKVATQQAATDPLTGLIDMGLISTGITAGSRTKINQLIEHIKDILKGNDTYSKKGIKFTNLYEELKKKFDVAGVGTTEAFTEMEYKEALKSLEEDGVIDRRGNKRNEVIKLASLLSQK